MTKKIKVEGVEYDVNSLSLAGQRLVKQINFTDTAIKERSNKISLLNKAKNVYVDNLKLEIVQSRTGVAYDQFFDEA